MPDNGAVIITGKLDDTELTKSIDKLVRTVDDKLGIAASHFEQNIMRMQISLDSLARNANTKVGEIKNSFQQLGTTFDQFAKAIEKAAAAASGGGRPNGGGGSGSSSVSAPNFDSAQTVGELEKMIKQQEKYIKTLELGTEELKKQVALMEQQVLKKKQMTTSSISKDYKNAMSYYPSSNEIAVLQDRLMRLSTVYSKIRDEAIRTGKSMGEIFPQDKINRLNSAIDTTRQKIERLREAANKSTTTKGGSILPTNMTDVMGMSEKTLDEIALKMKAISQLRMQTPIGSKDIKELNNEYTRLSKLQSEVLGKNKALVESTSSLGRAFNYIKNRLAFALTIGTLTGFVRQLYEIRGQYELLERSLGVLLDSFSTGSRIFNELNQMAIQSPFTLIELGTAAKQLTAYNFEAREVVDTTRRLADISSALGVPMERLVYNLGQIRAQTVLTARDARDFANAGLAIVPELAKYYTELEGKVVSTADVFDRMKKKAVSYNDVMSVLYKITDEGGKFFDFQAKQAGTLKVQLANLNLAWNNLLNDLGKSNQGLLSFPVQGLREAFLHWKDIANIIETAVVGLGAYKLAQFAITKTVGTTAHQMIASAKAEARANVTRLERIRLTRVLTESEDTLLTRSKLLVANQRTMSEIDYIAALSATKMTKLQAMTLVALNKKNDALQTAMVRTNLLTQAEVEQALAMGRTELLWKRLSITMKGFLSTMRAMIFNPTTAFMAVLTIGMDIYNTWNEAKEAVRQFNQEVAKASSESSNSIKEFLSSKTISNFTDPEKLKNASSEEVQKTWEAIKEEIIKSSAAGMDFVSALEGIENMNQRVSKGFDYLNKIQAVHGALEEIDDETIAIQQDWSKWWNLDMGVDSLKENLEQYIDYLHVIANVLGSVEKARKDAASGESVSEDAIKELNKYLETLQGNIDETVDSMLNLFMNKNFDPSQEREGFNKITDQLVQDMNLSVEQGLILRNQLEQRYAERRYALYKEENAKQASSNFAFWQKEFNTRQSFEDDFLKWMSRNHRSEVQKMFGDMTREEIKQIDWSTPKWKQWAETNAKEFARQYNLSFDDLKHLVNNANSWSVRIPVFFDFLGLNKSFFQQLTDADSAVADAEKRIKRLQEAINSGTLNPRELKKANDELKTAQEDLDKALKEHGKSSQKSTKSRGGATKAAKAQKQAEDAVAKALREEISVINEMQSSYDKLRKAGVGTTDALTIASSGYDKTLKSINATLSKYGISPFKAEDFVGSSDPHKLLKALQDQLNTLVKSGKVKTASLKDLEMEIKKITVDAREYDMKKITDGLNNELGKIKEEYELAVELDANPELGDMFADMFGINVGDLPHTFSEAYDRANKVAISKLKELQADVKDFDLMSINVENFAKSQGLEVDSQPIQDLMKLQQTWRDMFKKNITETEKYLDDYVKKYGNMSDKIAEIEADRLNKIKQLNEAYYTEQMRKMPEYTAKLDAINKGAEREKGGVRFDEFKNSRLYVTMFENLQYVSTATLETIRQKLAQLKSEMGTLTPEQLKQVVQQFEKIDNELRNRSPFKGLLKNYNDYIKANGKAGKQAEKDLVVAQENYDKQMQVVTALKEQLEQKKAQTPQDHMGLILLQGQILVENLKLEKLKEELEKAIELNEQYNLMKKVFGEQWQLLGKLAQSIATNFKSLGELRDYLKDAGVDFGDMFDGVVDSLQGVSDGINQMVSSASSGDIFGTITGTIKTVFGIGDAIASIFGDGAARTRRINREIEKSQEQVRKLNMAYKDLERTVDKAMGSQETAAQRALIANKKLEKEEVERQLRLEKSKRSKDRDEDAIKQYEERGQELTHQIEDLGDSIVENLLGSNIKSAAEDFVDTWVSAWKEGENTLDAVEGKMDEITKNLIKKAIASKIVGALLQPFYDAVDKATSEESESGVELSLNELKQLTEMASSIGISINNALLALFTNLENMGIIDKGAGSAELSALQQGVSAMSESTAEALLAYWNANTQQQYVQSDLLMQIRDIVALWNGDVQIATQAQILLQLQMSYSIQMSIQETLSNWSSASGLAVRVELAN